MIDFRNDMVKLSAKYPFIEKVIINKQAWRDMCNSFDKTLQRPEGETEKHIKDHDGFMKFENLFVEGKDE